MSDLPSLQVQISRPFTYCGVDFGGPFLIREHKRRNAKLVKAYICIFVCFATKAVHIELVADLSSEFFMGLLSDLWQEGARSFVCIRKEKKKFTPST